LRRAQGRPQKLGELIQRDFGSVANRRVNWRCLPRLRIMLMKVCSLGRTPFLSILETISNFHSGCEAPTASINLLIASASAKWAVMAPVFVPMFMLTGISPELAQVTYRVGDSVTNIITPLMAYFPVIYTFTLRYDRRAGIGTLISMMLPYSVVFFVGWLLFLAVWLLAGWPLGPGAPTEYVPGGLTPGSTP
jgi:hypothetical protein